ncbi:hypothetical protein VNO80_03106 [Phaseolus coccineus]|uniref:TIR domain-containing protein n=1 Tax=Phaseolus coccineus TaxID=3886 RepID=A0AAN9NVE1_PHACN
MEEESLKHVWRQVRERRRDHSKVVRRRKGKNVQREKHKVTKIVHNEATRRKGIVRRRGTCCCLVILRRHPRSSSVEVKNLQGELCRKISTDDINLNLKFMNSGFFVPRNSVIFITPHGQHWEFTMPEHQMISAVASFSNSSSMVSSKKYDVFLSFRGEDTRMNFTSHLHEALKQKKLETYIDYQLEKGDRSHQHSSKQLKILVQGQIVIPVFYNIDPSHIRKQTGCYELTFATQQEELRCNKWRAALTEVANLAGWDSRNRIASEFLKEVVKDVQRKLTPRYPNQLKGLVGIEKSLKQIESLLKIGSSEVRTIGIWGMGGIEMGWEIVHQESIKDLGRRSRLWKHEEVHDVLKYNKGTDFVEGIILDLEKLGGNLYLSCDSLSKMTNMRFLRIHRRKWGCRFSVHLPDGIESLPNKLRYLEWEAFCLKSLPSNFCAEQLVELHMWNSKLKKLWDGVQNLVNLKTIDLDDSRDLIEIPDLSRAEKLEKVSLYDCESLCQLHPSILSLPILKYLILSGCKAIQSINLDSKSLNVLRLRGCSSLNEFSVTSEEMTHLDLSQTAIRELLSPMISLPKLTYLYLSGCRHIENINVDLKSLRVVTLVGCSYLKESSVASEKLTLLELTDTAICVLPSSIGHLLSLEELDLRGTNIECLPDSIKSLSMLRVLWLNDCKKLVSLELPQSLRELYINDCWKLLSLPELPPSVKEVSAFNCLSLEENITQELVLRHILQNCIPSKHQQYLYNPVYFDGGYFIFPCDHVTYNCGFHATESSITIPSLPKSHFNFGGTNEVDGPFKSIRFMFEFNGDNDTIKRCGVFPVYGTSSGFKLVSSSSKEIFYDVESQPRANGAKIGGCDKQNWEQLFATKRRKTVPDTLFL